MSEPTNMHGPASLAPQVSGKVAHCSVCGIQWQVRSTQPPYDDAKGCTFCGADQTAVHIEDESPNRW